MDPVTAVKYGLFVQEAYDMYDKNPGNLNPPPTPNFPKDYKLFLTIQMTESFFSITRRLFYGFFAQSKADPNVLVVALRGTRTAIEWRHDLDWFLTASPLCHKLCKDKAEGYVATGFLELYKTFGIMFPGENTSLPLSEALSLLPTPLSNLTVTTAGHSLGAALITLYTLEIACRGAGPTIYTFASPRVGDQDFAAKVNMHA